MQTRRKEKNKKTKRFMQLEFSVYRKCTASSIQSIHKKHEIQAADCTLELQDAAIMTPRAACVESFRIATTMCVKMQTVITVTWRPTDGSQLCSAAFQNMYCIALRLIRLGDKL